MPRRCLVTAAAEQVYPYHEPAALTGHRRRLLHRAGGRVLDLSSRWSANQACYHPRVVESLSVLAAPAGFARPLEWADEPVVDRLEVLGGDIDSLDVAPAAYDTVVATMALCTVADLDGRLAAIARSLRGGGQLLMLEHVRGTGLTGMAQAIASPLEEAIGTGCRIDQQLAPALRRGGFDLTDCARFTAWVAGVPTPCLAGVARHRPTSAAGAR